MNQFQNSHKEKEQVEYDELLVENKKYDLVLFNDDVNTFDWVIECLIKICNHDEIQAEQSAFIVHYKGKCTVKSGEWDVLEPMHRALSNCDLSVEIL
jgi:ATP-dependent Clp protease adaptor protein ClpS